MVSQKLSSSCVRPPTPPLYTVDRSFHLSAERRGGVCRRPRRGRRTGPGCFPRCPSVRIPFLPFLSRSRSFSVAILLQEIPLYGQQSNTEETRARREDPRDQKDSEHGRVFTRSTGALIYLSSFFFVLLTIGSTRFFRRVKERRQRETGMMPMTLRTI